MKIEEGKIYKFKSSHPVLKKFWGQKVIILKTNCDLPFNATIKAKLLKDNKKIDCYKHDFIKVKNNIKKL